MSRCATSRPGLSASARKLYALFPTVRSERTATFGSPWRLSGSASATAVGGVALSPSAIEWRSPCLKRPNTVARSSAASVWSVPRVRARPSASSRARAGARCRPPQRRADSLQPRRRAPGTRALRPCAVAARGHRSAPASGNARLRSTPRRAPAARARRPRRGQGRSGASSLSLADPPRARLRREPAPEPDPAALQSGLRVRTAPRR